MGINLFGGSFCGGECSPIKPIINKNPDPRNWIIKDIEVRNNFTIAYINYPNCDNFEGNKILVFKGDVSNEILNSSVLDPHFCDGNHLSPIARFIPTAYGLDLAIKLTKIL